jgi:uncharacterized protein
MRTLRVAVALAVAALASGTVSSAETPLLDALEANNRELALDLLDGGADAKALGPDGTTTLMWAVYYGDVELAERLTKAGVDVDAQNEFGTTALAEAARLGSAQLLRVLLAAGARADATNPEGETALMLVARTGELEAARVLLDAGADVNAREAWGSQTALMWAAAQRQSAMMKLLIDAGAQVDTQSTVRDWARKATAEPRPKEMQLGGFTALMYAAREGCVECAKVLLDAGANANLADPENETPLVLSLENLHFDFAALLIGAGADVNKWDVRGRSPLYMAADMSTVPESFRYDLPSTDATTGADVVRMLLEAGANPNLQLKRKPPYRERVMDRGGDMILHVGATPLLRAAKAADVEVVKLLLEHGALVDLPNAYGVTPFLAAAGYGNNDRSTRGLHRDPEKVLETMRILMTAGADIHARSLGEPKGVPRPSRHYDAVMGQRGRHMYADRQVPSEIAVAHRNAAHAAAMRGLNFVLQFLADNGVALDLKDADGHTPLDLAKGNYEPEHRLNKPNPLPETMAFLEALLAGHAPAPPVQAAPRAPSTP